MTARVNPVAALVGEDAGAVVVGSAHGVFDAVLIGTVPGENVGGALIEINDAAGVLRLGRLDEQIAVDGDAGVVEIDAGPAQAEGPSAAEAGVGDETECNEEVVSLAAGEIEYLADGGGRREDDLTPCRRRGSYERAGG